MKADLCKRNVMPLMDYVNGLTEDFILNLRDFDGKDGKHHHFWETMKNEIFWVSENAEQLLVTHKFKLLVYQECKKPGLPDVDPKTKKSNWVRCLIAAMPAPKKSITIKRTV